MEVDKLHRVGDPNQLSLGQLLMQVCRLTGERLRFHMEAIGLHRGQGFVLFCLRHHDGIPQSEIARARHIRPASVSNMLKRMERDGWIERRRDEEDERIVRVYLTDKARALHDEARARFRTLEEEITGTLAPADQAAFKEHLLEIHRRLLELVPKGKRNAPPWGGPKPEDNEGGEG